MLSSKNHSSWSSEMITVISGFVVWRVVARVSSERLNASACAGKGASPLNFSRAVSAAYWTPSSNGMTQPCGGNASSGFRLSPSAYVSQSSGRSDSMGVWDVPMPSTISAIRPIVSKKGISRCPWHRLADDAADVGFAHELRNGCGAGDQPEETVGVWAVGAHGAEQLLLLNGGWGRTWPSRTGERSPVIPSRREITCHPEPARDLVAFRNMCN